MDSIVLRDRNGKEINYHGIDYLNVKTPDGETQGYAAYDPETLVPENLVSGVVVGDVEGALKVPQAVETTINPDFSAGDMEIVPEDGQVFSKVGILKPANLLPENITKDVDIAGVVGTLEPQVESSGGNPVPWMFMAVQANAFARLITGTSSPVSVKPSISIPYTAKLVGVYTAYISSRTTNSTSMNITAQPVITGNSRTTSYTGGQGSTSISITDKLTGNSSYPVQYINRVFLVVFTMTGIYMRANSGGNIDMYADETATELPGYGVTGLSMSGNIDTIDLSESAVTSIPSYLFFGSYASKIVLPPCLTKINTYALTTSSSTVYDFSQAQSVPTLASSDSITCSGDSQILVPAALYEEWIAATNWSAKADYIVAV